VAALFVAAWIPAAISGRFTISDSYDYLWQAENLEAGRFWYAGDLDADLEPRLFSRRPPGYAAFLVALRAVSTHPLWIAFIQSLLGVATWVLLWRMLVRMGGARRWEPLVLGLALAPPVLIYAQMVMSDVLFTFLVVAAFERFVAFVQRERLRDFALFHGLLAVGVLVKPVLLYVWLVTAPLSVPVLRLRGVHGRTRGFTPQWPTALAFLVAVPALGLGWAHERQTGRFEVSSIETENLLQQNAGRLLRRTGEDAVLADVERQAESIARDPERASFEAAAARRIILDRPFAYAALHLQGALNLLLDPGRFDLEVFFGLPPEGPGLMARFSDDGWRGVARGLAALPMGQTLFPESSSSGTCSCS
jgi:hypothetical protein